MIQIKASKRKHPNRSFDKIINIYKNKKTILRIVVDRFLHKLSETERKYAMTRSKTMALLPGNPYL